MRRLVVVLGSVVVAVLAVACSGITTCAPAMCIRDEVDGGCTAGVPVCCSGTQGCPTGYSLRGVDAGGSCGPVPSAEQVKCL
jgi:hypothetical protein